jgi:hypothetical protein
MVRKATWSIVLLLLASVQSLAMACGVRCTLMTMPAHAGVVQSSMPAMQHCKGMSSSTSGSESARLDAQASQRCSSGICSGDLAAVKSIGVAAERTDIALSPLADVIFSGSVLLAVSSDKTWRPPASRSTKAPSNLNPLLANLRI